MVALPSLRGLQAFEAAARTGSFAAAAEELSISAAAVSQLIRTVEEQMGRQLFHRINRRAVLTEAGVEMLPRLTVALEDGKLVRTAAHSLELRQPYCLTIPERCARRDIVGAFREWLVEECVRAVRSPALGALST